MSAEATVVHFKTETLDRIGHRIDAAWKRAHNGEAEWVEGSLELMQALHEGRGRFPSDTKFGAWLTAHDHHHISHQDRAALIGMASDLALAREVLTQTKSKSYELIWRSAKDRFTNNRKPARPKNTKTNRRTTPKTDRVYEHIVKKMTEGGTLPQQKEIAEEIGASSRVTQRAYERWHTEQARESVKANTEEALLASAQFSEKGKLSIETAIRIYKGKLDKSFEHIVNTEVRRRIDAADNFTRQDNIRLSAENLALTRVIGQYAVFTRVQFRQMLMLCHPDNSASPQTRATLLDLLVKNERTLVKPD